MATNRPTPQSIDEYIAGFPADVQALLQQIRATIRDVAPDAEETISYGIPTFRWKGTYLIHFAGYKKHLSLYPAPRGAEAFREELSAYKGGKGTVQFPLDRLIPFDLVRRIVAFRAQEIEQRAGGQSPKQIMRGGPTTP